MTMIISSWKSKALFVRDPPIFAFVFFPKQRFFFFSPPPTDTNTNFHLLYRAAALPVRAGQSTRVNIHSGLFCACRQLERKIEMQNDAVFFPFLFRTLHRNSVRHPARHRAHVNWNKHSVCRSRTVVVVAAAADRRS